MPHAAVNKMLNVPGTVRGVKVKTETQRNIGTQLKTSPAGISMPSPGAGIPMVSGRIKTKLR